MEKDKKEKGIDEYTQPLLTKHEPLLNLTGKSMEKDPLIDKDPDEKDKDYEGVIP
ncbi:MAG: hypothetical protein ACM3PP_02325 [Candidatus Saccharibacteria bacterium]